ncbi:hypothetical protein [Acidithiobacillus ferrooxidans]|uniref:hypothetical protein n=1 Tax=Acidithiobacillus ferrooxidans TaxID=920 RepID=UPI0021498A2A|nr:hypothetical protein [Acidithiobacillus ferrooxidans]MCR1351339.1 hypothetical protein [Acidithiobacillus ferrooxidans]
MTHDTIQDSLERLHTLQDHMATLLEILRQLDDAYDTLRTALMATESAAPDETLATLLRGWSQQLVTLGTAFHAVDLATHIDLMALWLEDVMGRC